MFVCPAKMCGLAKREQNHSPLPSDHMPASPGSHTKKRPLSTVIIPPARGRRQGPLSVRSAPAQIVSTPTSTHMPSFSFSSSAWTEGSAERSPDARHRQHPWLELGMPAGAGVLWHAALPLPERDERPMASAITSYVELARSMLTRGTPVPEILGPDPPSVDLVFRPRSNHDPHSVCHFAAELTAGIKDMDMATKLGVTVMFAYLIRVSSEPPTLWKGCLQ